MKKVLSSIAILFLAVIASGQSAGNNQDGYQIFRYPNGTISSEGKFRNGKPDGFW